MRRLGGLLCRASAAVLVCAGLAVASLAIAARPAGAATPPSNCAGAMTITCTFNYNGTNGSDGSVQHFTVPAGVDHVTLGFANATIDGGPLTNPKQGFVGVFTGVIPSFLESANDQYDACADPAGLSLLHIIFGIAAAE
jgi:hypothetical protein